MTTNKEPLRRRSEGFRLLNGQWNRPGRFIRGPLYKWSMVNILSVLVGMYFLVGTVLAATYQTESYGGRISGQSYPIECGSVIAPRDGESARRGQFAPDRVLGQWENEWNAERCKNERSTMIEIVLGYGVLATLFIAGGAIAAIRRDPKNSTWGPLSRQRIPTPKRRTTVTAQMNAGWYPDQNNPDVVRWFNGTNWTDATLPKGDTDTSAKPL